MVDMLSPLHNKLIAGHFGASGDAGIHLSERPITSMWQIAGWDDFETAAMPALKTMDLDGIGTYREAQTTGEITAWRIAPDKMLIEGSDDLSEYATDGLMVLDLSHAKTAITLSGTAARDLLAQLFAIDVSPDAFAQGQFLQTGIHHVGVLVHCNGNDSFDILVAGTWAETVWETINENALPHGVMVKEAA